MVTMQKVAELCGVSRGTVDRALHGRGRVSEETAANVRRVAEELGYEPNPAAKALSASKKKLTVAVVLPSEGNPFFDEVIRGIRTAAESYKIYGLSVQCYTMKGYSPEGEAELISRAASADAIVLNPIEDDLIRAAVNKLVNAGKFVVTLNGDLSDTKRQCYVGSDYYRGGMTACALLSAFTGGKAEIGVVLGSQRISGHLARYEAFCQRMEDLPDMRIAAVIENEDDDFLSFERTKKMLSEHPEITALYLVAGGVYGACRAVRDLPAAKRPQVIAFDSVPSTIEMMEEGIIKAILYQHPYRQGKRAMELAFDYLINGRSPQKSEYIMKHEIKLLENLY